MQLDERLQKDKDRRDKLRRQPDPDEDVETMLYDIRKPMEFINKGEGGVFDIRRQTGINSAPSVFDKGAIFHA